MIFFVDLKFSSHRLTWIIHWGNENSSRRTVSFKMSPLYFCSPWIERLTCWIRSLDETYFALHHCTCSQHYTDRLRKWARTACKLFPLVAHRDNYSCYTIPCFRHCFACLYLKWYLIRVAPRSSAFLIPHVRHNPNEKWYATTPSRVVFVKRCALSDSLYDFVITVT